jgi:hypothetical protein
MEKIEGIAGTEYDKMLFWDRLSCQGVELSEVTGTESLPIFTLFTLKMGTDSVLET